MSELSGYHCIKSAAPAVQRDSEWFDMNYWHCFIEGYTYK